MCKSPGVQDAFLSIPGFISCVGVTGSGHIITCYAHVAPMTGLLVKDVSMYSTYMFMNSETMVYSLREKKSSLYVSLTSAPSVSFRLPLVISFPLPSLPPSLYVYIYSVWFNTARVGLVVGLLGWFLNFMPYLFVSARYATLGLYVPRDMYNMHTYSVNMYLYSRAVACLNRASFRHCC